MYTCQAVPCNYGEDQLKVFEDVEQKFFLGFRVLKSFDKKLEYIDLIEINTF